MKNFLLVVLGVAMFASVSANAHDELISSTPENSAVLAVSPSAIKMTFSGEVRLVSVELLSDDGAKHDLDFSMSRTAHAVKEVPVVNELPTGAYTVEWRAMSSDSHRFSGDFSFEVK